MESRFDNAVSMTYPRDWQSVWQDDHKRLVHRLFRGPSDQTVQAGSVAALA
jgi:hypothetical protein